MKRNFFVTYEWTSETTLQVYYDEHGLWLNRRVNAEMTVEEFIKKFGKKPRAHKATKAADRPKR